jgi:hypothetical protein
MASPLEKVDVATKIVVTCLAITPSIVTKYSFALRVRR